MKCIDRLELQLATAVAALEEITTNLNCTVNYACVQIARDALTKMGRGTVDELSKVREQLATVVAALEKLADETHMMNSAYRVKLAREALVEIRGNP